ncbi:cell division initiation protein [Hathewaya proteolytica DSM 3090]|uniref:Cell division initiation protein n=1 Tax=Hathewaya proteolytica DSM 3090 TaxID=1121331 RepID=A0A1M6L6R8_9CLOT|nr:DivIVA domain-containing protein [Hathewaya proteolytica]SHJ66886.1 cell division initiation protein [Hathewaya proteolytica DSM 3090]
MRITSMDIDSKDFKKSFRGYDIDDVNDFLNDVADTYDELYKENSLYKEKISNYEEKVENYKRIEETIQNTLVLAQGAAEQVKQAARKEADGILQEARDNARIIVQNANNDVIKINQEYERLKQEFEKFKVVFRNFMNSQMDMFETLDDGFKKQCNELNINQQVSTASEKEEQKTSLQGKPSPVKMPVGNPLIFDEFVDDESVSIQENFNDFLTKNNIDLSSIKSTSPLEVGLLNNSK